MVGIIATPSHPPHRRSRQDRPGIYQEAPQNRGRSQQRRFPGASYSLLPLLSGSADLMRPAAGSACSKRGFRKRETNRMWRGMLFAAFRSKCDLSMRRNSTQYVVDYLHNAARDR